MEFEKLDVFFEGVPESVVDVGGSEWVLLLLLVAMRPGNRHLARGLRQVRQAQIIEMLSSTALGGVSNRFVYGMGYDGRERTPTFRLGL